MLFADTTESTTGGADYSKSYWLASPGVSAHLNYAAFNVGIVTHGYASLGHNDNYYCNLFMTSNEWYAVGFAVRPVVVLKSNVTVEQIQVIEDQTETPWTTEGGQSYGGTLE